MICADGMGEIIAKRLSHTTDALEVDQCIFQCVGS